MEQLIEQFEKHFSKEFIRSLVVKHIFCKFTGKVLDYRTCILIELHEKGKFKDAVVVAPELEDRLEKIKEKFNSLGKDVKFFSLNKKITLPG